MKKLMIIVVAGILLILSALGAENHLYAEPKIPPADFIQAFLVSAAENCDFTGTEWAGVPALILGMDPDELCALLMEEGQTLAGIARTHGVDPRTIFDAIFAAETDWIDEMITSGELTYEEAEEWKAWLEEDIHYFVEEGYSVFEDVDISFKGVEWVPVVALTLEIDPDELLAVLQEEGQTLAGIAKARGVDPQTIIDIIIAVETDCIDEVVASGEHAYEEAEEWKAALEEDVRYFVEEGFPVFKDMDLAYEDEEWAEVSALILGMDPDELCALLMQEGQILAGIARDHGVDPQTIIDAIFAAETDWINEMAASCELTYEEAEEWKAGLEEDIRCFVEQGYSMFEDENLLFKDIEWVPVVALTLGMDPDELFTALLDAGLTLAEITRARGVDPQTIIDIIIITETDCIYKMAARGELTYEEAEEWKTGLEEDVRRFVEKG